jgi:hypothetical protein
MTEQWLIQDIKKLKQHRNRVVLPDPTGQCSFVLPISQQNQIDILQTDNSIFPARRSLFSRQRAGS